MTRSKTRTTKAVALALLGLGLLLLGYMVTVEGEPGALPLGLVLVGGLTYAVATVRERRG
ncbi:hypothetical protein [Lysobacter xanthus]